MISIKKIAAALAAAVLAVTASACHPKDEVAVTVGKVKFTSAYYMCALINADSEGKSKVKENLSDSESSSNIDYYSKKIDNKSFVKWVEDTALDNLKLIAAYKTLCEENKLELSEDDVNTAEKYANYYWANYGYSSYFEPNGVSQKTYTQYMKDSYFSGLYFEHLYGAEGTKAIDAETVKNKIYENFVIADVINASYTSKTDDEKTELKNKFETYAEELKKGSRTFEEVYKDYNGSTDKDGSTETDEKKPKDKYASIIGNKDTAYESDNFDEINKMATGEIKVIELADSAGIMLVVKQDIKSDDYYIENLDLSARHLIADDEYEKDMKEYASKLKTDVNDYAVKQFKVKKIKEPSTK